MELDKNIRICNLFDIYGYMLSKKQQQMINEHFYQDCSLTEIAENQGISRQAVLDAITKSTNKLEDFESKLHLLNIKSSIMKLEGTKEDKKILNHIKSIL